MASALVQIRLTRAVEFVQHALRRVSGTAPGFREIEGWWVADGAEAAQAAIVHYYHQGGLAPTEITMMAQLVALYGGQVALSEEGVMLMFHPGLPEHIVNMAQAAGFTSLALEGKPYEAMTWVQSP